MPPKSLSSQAKAGCLPASHLVCFMKQGSNDRKKCVGDHTGCFSLDWPAGEFSDIAALLGSV